MHIAHRYRAAVLREFVIDDWPAVLAYQRDLRYLRFYLWANRTEARVQDFVEMFVQQQSERPRRKFQFAITFPNDDTRAGEGGTATGRAVARE